MSADARPITPTRFATALKELPSDALFTKLLELRNSIAHLDYSNEQLRPYAEGTARALDLSNPSSSQQPSPEEQEKCEPDQDCIDAIKENEAVIERMQERIRLLRAEVESRGERWTDFEARARRAEEERRVVPEMDNTETIVVEHPNTQQQEAPTTNRTGPMVNGTGERSHPAWSDGTFQTGVIRDGVIEMHGPRLQQGGERQPGRLLTDEELRRRVEEQIRRLGVQEGDEEEGLYL